MSATPNTRLNVNKPVNSSNVKAVNATAATANAGKSGKMSENLKKGWNKTKEFFTGKKGIILVIIGVILLFLLVIIYILFMMKSSKLSGKQLTTKPIRLDTITTPLELASSLLPASVVGREYSYSFWIYLESYDQTYTTDPITNKVTPVDKLIFYRGIANDITTANPVITMDGLSNKMYISIKTQNSTLTSIPGRINYNNNLYYIRFMNYFMNSNLKIKDMSNPDQPSINKYIILPIDYVPLQRWVNITFVIDNKLTIVYLDGEIYSVKNADESKTIREPELDVRGRPVDVNMIIDKTDNNVYVGKNSAVGNNTTITGYLGKLQYYNYALALNQVKSIYNSGPVGGSWFGGSFPYSVRNPIYRLDTTSTSDSS